MRLVSALRLAYGTLLLFLGPRLLAPALERGAHDSSPTVVRVLGARHVVQAVVCAVWPTRAVGRVSVALDGLHAATDVGCALLDRPYRRAASIDLGPAIAFAVGTLAVTRRRGR